MGEEATQAPYQEEAPEPASHWMKVTKAPHQKEALELTSHRRETAKARVDNTIQVEDLHDHLR